MRKKAFFLRRTFLGTTRQRCIVVGMEDGVCEITPEEGTKVKYGGMYDTLYPGQTTIVPARNVSFPRVKVRKERVRLLNPKRGRRVRLNKWRKL